MMFIGRSMIVICSAPIRVIISIVRNTAMPKKPMRPMSTAVESTRPAPAGMQPVEKVDMDVPRAANGRGNADEDRAHQQIAGDFLGPRRGVVHHVAREELVEHAQTEEPEEPERQPVLEQVMPELDRRVLDVEMTLLVEDVRLRVPGGVVIFCVPQSCGSLARRRPAPRLAHDYLIATILS